MHDALIHAWTHAYYLKCTHNARMARIEGFLITHRIKIARTHKNVCIGKICKADARYKKNPHTKKPPEVIREKASRGIEPR